jgi:hypothetical protein
LFFRGEREKRERGEREVEDSQPPTSGQKSKSQKVIFCPELRELPHERGSIEEVTKKQGKK